MGSSAAVREGLRAFVMWFVRTHPAPATCQPRNRDVKRAVQRPWLGEQQMVRSMSLWGLPRIDLMQIHNVLDWEAHLHTRRRWKAEERLLYIGPRSGAAPPTARR